MANVIKIKRSTVPGKIPLDSDLEIGELALNTADGVLYTKHSDQTLKKVSGNLVVSNIDGNNQVSNVVAQVSSIRFDTDSGFDVVDLGSGTVKVGMNSTFKTIKVDGQDDLIALGLDTLEIIAGNKIEITTNANADPKALTISVTEDYYFGSTSPVNPNPGDQWFDTDESILYIYVDDGSSEYWLDISSSIAGPQGYTGSQGEQGAPGTSVAIIGSVADPSLLPSPYNGNIGDGYIVQDTGNLYVWDGANWNDVGKIVGYTGSQGDQGYTGSAGTNGYVGSQGVDGYTGSFGYTGSKGDTGLGFRIAKSYSSVAALLADTSPTGIVAGEFAIIETGDVEDPENSRLYIWTGTQYTYVSDLSGAAGLTGPQGNQGYTGSAGTDGYVGSSGASSFFWGNSAPVSPEYGDRWFDIDESILYIFVSDGNSEFWLDISSAIAGPIGYTGSQGDTGFVGSQGDVGFAGSQGDIGYTGSQGDVGFVGSQGDVGFVGSQGDTGFVGSQGDTGFVGSQGDIGYTGSQGELGYTGSAGQDGIIGQDGYTGSQGDTGFVGSQGDIGYTGSTGQDGYTGSQGDTGFVGSQGIDGYTGSKGDTGLGFRIAKSYSSVAALLADTNPTGILPGEFAIIETGDVEDPENSRLYIWTGSQYTYVSDLSGAAGITGPQGTIGYTGSSGADGYTGSIGADGYTGSSGASSFFWGNSAPVSPEYGDRWFDVDESILYIFVNDGNSDFWLDISSAIAGPAGYTGSEGYTGSQGDTGFVGSQGDTGFVGSQGDIGYTGSQGDTGFVGSQGDIGYTGSQGDIGYTGSQGDIGYTGSQGDTGFVGSKGDIGYTGSQGDTGFVGSQGDLGYTGSEGVGYTGSQGDTGFVGSQGESSFTWGNTAPVSPIVGDRWFDTQDGVLLVYVDDNDSQQWVEVSASGFLGQTGYTGSAGASAEIDLSAINQNIVPSANVTYDLGTDSNRWRDLYLAGNTIYLGSAQLSSNDSGGLDLPENSRIGATSIAEALSSATPKIASIDYPGDDTAADPAGGQTLGIVGNGFQNGASVLLDNQVVGVVTFVSSTRLEITSPAKSSGSYMMYVINPDGGTGIFVPGVQYSGLPNWLSPPAGSLGSAYETQNVTSTFSANSDSSVTYSLQSGTLPPGTTLDTNTGVLSGTADLTAGNPVTYNFTVRATDAENQDTDRSFSFTINPDVITWQTPLDGSNLDISANVPYTTTLTASSVVNDQITYSANALPSGLSLSGDTISGSAESAGNITVELTATGDNTTRSSTITVTFSISVQASFDEYFNKTSLLLNGDVETFITDASDNAFTITPAGDTRPSAFSPYNTSWSVAIDGSDYLEVTQNADLAFQGGGAFTWETFINMTTGGLLYGSYTGPSNAGGSFIFQCDSTNKTFSLGWIINGTDTWDFANGADINVLTLGKWHHIAASYDGNGTLRYFVDGVLVTTRSVTVNVDTMVYNVRIGRSMHPSYPIQFVGWLSNMRFVKGYCLYTENFTAPTTTLTAVTGTVFLAFTTNRHTYDASTVNNTIAVSGTPLTSSFGPFTDTDTSTGSAYFDGTGDYIAADNSFALGTSDFTLECWIYVTQASDDPIYESRNTNNVAGGFTLTTLDSSTIRIWDTQARVTASGLTYLNRWTHVCVERISGTTTLYIDGVSRGTTTAFTDLSNTNYLRIGGSPHYGGFGPGYISDFRIVKDSYVYGGNFTPPTAPLTAVSGTQLLTLQNRIGYNNSQPIDESGIKNVITRAGNASVGAFNPIGLHGWGAYNGVGSFQIVNQNGCFSMGTGDFTIEFWIRTRSRASSQQFLFDGRINANSNNNLYMLAGGLLRHGDSTDIVVINWPNGYGDIPLGEWHHIAIVRNNNNAHGDNWCVFYDGVPAGTGTYTSTVNDFNMRLFGRWDNSYSDGNHDISNFRVTKKAVYTDFTNGFTPSTVALEVLPETTVLAFRDRNFLSTDSTQKITVTASSASAATITGPFRPHTITPDSYSVYFDGSGDRLYISPSQNLSFGTGDFTIEYWMYPFSNTSSNRMLGNGTSPYGTNDWSVYPYNSTGKLAVDIYNVIVGSAPLVSTTTIVPNNWYHIVITRTGNTFKLFVNGIQESTATSSASFDGGVDSGLFVGDSGFGEYYNGYISNLRLVKGTAVYTSNFTPPTAPLTAVSGTSLLTCQSPTVIDNSTNAFAITVNGNSQPTKFNPFGETVTEGVEYSPASHGGSVYFNADDKLSIADNTDLELGTSDFTIEFWYNAASFVCLLTKGWGTSQYAQYLFQNVSNTLKLYMTSANGSWNIANGQTFGNILYNTWQHVALTRKGSTFRGFLDGVQGFTFTSTASLYDNSLPIIIGNRDDLTADMDGYISGLRIVKGTSLYDGNFVPPQAPPTPTSGTTLLLNGTNAAIQDKTGRNVLETVGNARTLSESPYRLNKSVYFDGTDDYIYFGSNDTALAFGSGDFTLEGWVNFGSVTGDRTIYSRYDQGADTGFMLRLSTTNSPSGLRFYAGAGGGGTGLTIQKAWSPVVGTWYHIAVVRNSNNIYIYIDGVLLDTATSYSGTIGEPSNTNSRIGAYASGSGPLLGYVSNFRLVKGTAVYTEDFDDNLPTSPLTAISGTSLLTCQSYNFKDNSTNDFTITRNGDAKISSRGPFTETQTSDNAMYFDGTGDYLVTNGDTSQFTFGTGDFTIEFWLQSFDMGASADKALIDFRPSGPTNGAYPYLYIYQSKIKYYFQTADRITQSDTLTLGSWHHVALTRAGTVTRLFVDGVEKGSYTNGDSCSVGSQRPVIGCNTGLGANFNGYIDDLRITKGVARYTANFTPPTSAHLRK